MVNPITATYFIPFPLVYLTGQPPTNPQVTFLLKLLHSSIATPLSPLPYSLGLFLSRACAILALPNHDLYPAVNGFLLKKSVLNMEEDMICEVASSFFLSGR